MSDWKEYKFSDAKDKRDYGGDVLSTINLKDSIELIKPAATSFYNILINITLKKYPDELSSASIRHHLDTQILEMKHRGLLDMTGDLKHTKTVKQSINDKPEKPKTNKKNKKTKTKKLKDETENQNQNLNVN